MDTPSADFLKDQLTLFRQSVRETARNISAPSDPCSWHAGAPFTEKCRVRDLLVSSPLSMAEKTALVEEFHRVAEELDVLLVRYGQVYRDLLLVELENQVHAYHAETCLSSYWCDNECARSGRGRRELIEELLVQLRDHYPLSSLEMLVATIDDNAARDEVVMTDKVSSEEFPSYGLVMQCNHGNDKYLCGGARPSARHV
ncbi:hypothetical protein [Methanoregula sp.]|uniref:hypothetical protein n=1 Tax=Methanoregula sp. TaxID=2052170 RepID=UPI000CC6265C|nr:hypothetical protein [Methanoregula sp.]PKG32931.1 MAG: hypothetical protein CW742_05575 [Methanoregula sp.]